MNLHGIQLDSPEIRGFCIKWKIKQLSVVGSILRDDFLPDSDVDFLAEFEQSAVTQNYDLFDDIHMHDELSQIVGREVDIIDRSVIESGSNRYIRAELLGTAEAVYARR